MNSKTVRDFGHKEPVGTAQLSSKFSSSASDVQTVHILGSPFFSRKWFKYHIGLTHPVSVGLVSFPPDGRHLPVGTFGDALKALRK